MARPIRIEAEGGVYHVLNRGNYRTDIFSSERTKAAFLQCLGQACTRTGWRVHAWAVMSNHYHLALTTPRPNLVEGMRWLQGTFANRFNRLRGERGHVFQGRYKSLRVDPGDGLGPLCHYIHLNPVRAHLCPAVSLAKYPWTSLGWIVRPRVRAPWYDPSSALAHAGALADTEVGRGKYCEYLTWLAEDEPAQKDQKFDAMCRGWIIGKSQFVKAVTEEHGEVIGRNLRQDRHLRPTWESSWQEVLDLELIRCSRSPQELLLAGKSAPWKLQLALVLRRRTTATNRWIADHLRLGRHDYLSRRLSALDKNDA